MRYYGIYSARGRVGQSQGKAYDKAVSSTEQFDRLDDEVRPKASLTWAALLKRVFEVDPLCCPKCQGSMRIKAFITDPKQVARITKNLGLCPWRAPPPLPKSVDIGPTQQTVFPDDFSQLHWS